MRDVLRHEETFGAAMRAEEGVPEKRATPRFAVLIRAAKLVCTAGEFLCVVRDASESGLNIRVFHPLPNCDDYLLEMQNGDRHQLELIWQEDDRVGMKFAGPADIARIVESPSRFAKRQIRVNLEVAATIVAGLQKYPARIHDISQQGARISCDQRFAIDQQIKLKGEDLPEVNAKVRWRRDGEYGLVFEETFQYGDFARAAGRIQLGQGV